MQSARMTDSKMMASDRTRKVRLMSNYKGVDLSEHNTGIDYTTLSKQIDFVVLREGCRQREDYMFKTHLYAFKALGVPIIGVYHFIYALTNEQAKQEAMSCIKNVEAVGLPKTTVIWADFEYDTITKAKAAGVTLRPAECNQFTRTFCDAVKAAGYPTGIYTNLDYWRNWYTQETLKRYDIWLADYAGGPDYPCIMQQYTSNGRINGYSKNLDMNYYFGTLPSKQLIVEVKKSTVEKAIEWMENLAKDDAHGYDQIYRWGQKGDYDCSSAVITAWEQAGVPVKSNGATYTGNMRSVFLKCGFKDVSSKVNVGTGSGLIRGDVLLNSVHHTAMYCGNGKEVEASINERGGATSGEPGDQTGREILIRSYRNYPWNYVLRYESMDESETVLTDGSGCYMFEVKTVRIGNKNSSVLLMQKLLRVGGYKGKDGKTLNLDGSDGTNTDYALRGYQKKMGLVVDGVCGVKTWGKLLGI